MALLPQPGRLPANLRLLRAAGPSHRVQNEALLTECSSTLRQTVTLAVVVLLLLALRLPELFSAPLYGLAEGHALAPHRNPDRRSRRRPAPPIIQQKTPPPGRLF